MNALTGGAAESSASAICLAILLLSVSCGSGEGPAPTEGPPPPEVTVVEVVPETVPQEYEFTGEVVPYRRVEVRARVDGIIESRPFTEGMMVRAGQVLYQLERVRYEAAHRSALARLENAERTLRRLEPLAEVRAVAAQDVDDARSELEAAQAALDQAKKDLDDTTVKAEMAGRVGRTNLEVGARVTGPADLLTTIDRLDPVYVSFRPSSQQRLEWERDPAARALIQPGSKLEVRVVLQDGSLLPTSGRLDFVAPSLDAATGTQEFRATFQNPDRLLVPGQFVRVRMIGFASSNALAVPQRAVMTGMGRQFVYVVVAGDTAVARDIETGSWTGDRWIITRGLAAGERVIVDGVQKVIPGQPVRPVAAADSGSGEPSPASPANGGDSK